MWGYTGYRGCMDQVCDVRQVCEKYLASGKYVFWTLMDIEKAYMIRLIGMVCGRCLSAWSWKKIVEGSAKFLSR